MATVTLGEGHTPLVPSVQIGPRLGLDRLFFKLENTNPSGSYKDRFAAAEVAHVLTTKSKGCLATSSGNTGSALAAYCVRYGLPCIIIVGATTPAGKLAQMQAHGAQVFRVHNFLTSPDVAMAAFKTLPTLAAELGLSLVVSAYRYCPVGMSGVESLSRELLEQSSSLICHVFVPAGGGGLFTAVCRGFESGGLVPLVHCVQPVGCDTIVKAYENGSDQVAPMESTTHISGLSVPFDIDGSLASRHLRRLGGRAITVRDENVYKAQQMLLREEGIYTEPAGATALAGLIEKYQEGLVKRDDVAVCLITGNGFKDPDSIQMAASKYPAIELQVGELKDAISEQVAHA